MIENGGRINWGGGIAGFQLTRSGARANLIIGR